MKTLVVTLSLVSSVDLGINRRVKRFIEAIPPSETTKVYRDKSDPLIWLWHLCDYGDGFAEILDANGRQVVSLDGRFGRFDYVGFCVDGNGLRIVRRDRDAKLKSCLLYTSPSPRDRTRSRMPSSA